MFTRSGRITWVFLVLVGGWLCCASILGAQDYFVSANGDDRQTGTSAETAWRTIARANEVVLNPGDRLLFEGGAVFEGTVELSADESGLPDRPIVVSSYGKGHASIASRSAAGFLATNVGGVSIRQLTFRGDGRETNTANGIVFYNDLPENVRLDHVHIEDVEVSGFGLNGISIGSWQDRSGYRDVSIIETTTHDNGLNGIFIYAMEPYVHEQVYIGRVRAYRNSGHPEVKPNSGSGIILSGVNGGILERSVAHDNGWLGTGSIGIWAYDSRYVTIQYNRSFNNHTGGQFDGGGFDLDGGMVDSVMQDNFSHDNDGAGFGLYQYAGAPTWERNTVRRNLSWNDGRKNGHAGIHIWNEGSVLRDAEISGNIVYMSRSTQGTPAAISFVKGADGLSIHHNVFFVEGAAQLIAASPGPRGVRLFENRYWPLSGASLIQWEGQTYQTLEAWEASSGQEAPR